MTGKLRTLRAVALLVLSFSLSVQASEVQPPHERFLAGFDAGGARVSLNSEHHQPGALVADIRLGGVIRHGLLLHVEGGVSLSSVWGRTTGTIGEPLAPVRRSWTLSDLTLAATWYPLSSGVFFRGGLGIGHADVGDNIKEETSKEETGLAAVSALGYDCRLSPRFRLAAEVEFKYLDLKTIGPARAIGGKLGWTWYR